VVKNNNMAFDPSKFGAVEIKEDTFDPTKFGAVPFGNEKQSLSDSLWSKIGKSVTSRVEKAGESIFKSQQGKQSGASGLLQAVGQGAGAVGDIGFEALKSVTPDFIQKPIGEAFTKGATAIAETQPAQDVMSKYQEFKTAHPEAAANLEASGLIASILPAGKVANVGVKGVKTVAKEGVDILGDIKKIAVNPILEKNAAKTAIADAQNFKQLIGTIVQGKKADIGIAEKALKQIDTTAIKTYDDLKYALNNKVKTFAQELDTHLAESPIHNKPLLIKDLDMGIKVGKETIQHNYVDDAFKQLDEIYSKTNDIEGKTILDQLKKKGETEGFTVQEINNLARLHGNKLNAFNANGEAASGLTKQAAENTRKGLKQTAREIYGDKVFNELDDKMSDLINTRELIDKVSENVNKLKQRVTERGLGEKIGRLVFQGIDIVSGGTLKGFVQSFIPRSAGLKIMNALDLEKNLQNNLQKFEKVLKENLTESQIKTKIDEIIQQSKENPFPAQPIKNSTTITNKTVISTTIPQSQFKSKTFQAGETVKKKYDAIPNKQAGMVKFPGLSKPIKELDSASKQEIIQILDYARNPKRVFDKNIEDSIGYYRDRFNIKDTSLGGIANKLEPLLEDTKTTDFVRGANKSERKTSLSPVSDLASVAKGKTLDEGGLTKSSWSGEYKSQPPKKITDKLMFYGKEMTRGDVVDGYISKGYKIREKDGSFAMVGEDGKWNSIGLDQYVYALEKKIESIKSRPKTFGINNKPVIDLYKKKLETAKSQLTEIWNKANKK
jgi:hypothetical protein